MGECLPRVRADGVAFVEHEKLTVRVVEADDAIRDCIDFPDLYEVLRRVEWRIRQARLKIGKEAGQRRTKRIEDRANALCRTWLESYEAPYLDPAIDEALLAYVKSRKDSMPDAFT